MAPQTSRLTVTHLDPLDAIKYSPKELLETLAIPQHTQDLEHAYLIDQQVTRLLKLLVTKRAGKIDDYLIYFQVLSGLDTAYSYDEELDLWLDNYVVRLSPDINEAINKQVSIRRALCFSYLTPYNWKLDYRWEQLYYVTVLRSELWKVIHDLGIGRGPR